MTKLNLIHIFLLRLQSIDATTSFSEHSMLSSSLVFWPLAWQGTTKGQRDPKPLSYFYPKTWQQAWTFTEQMAGTMCNCELQFASSYQPRCRIHVCGKIQGCQKLWWRILLPIKASIQSTYILPMNYHEKGLAPNKKISFSTSLTHWHTRLQVFIAEACIFITKSEGSQYISNA